MPRVAKNGPCPCGSGKRYKSCCLKVDRAARRQRVAEAKEAEQVRAQILVGDQRRQQLATDILSWAVKEDGQRAEPPFDLRKNPDAVVLVGEMGAYDTDRARRYLESEAGAQRSAEDRAIIEEALLGLTALWEVTEVRPGRGMTLRERFTGLVREVEEPELSDDVSPGRWIIGRVASTNGIYTLNPFPHLFTPEGAEGCAKGLLKLSNPSEPVAEGATLTEAQLRSAKLNFGLLWIAGQVGQGLREARVNLQKDLNASVRPAGYDL